MSIALKGVGRGGNALATKGLIDPVTSGGGPIIIPPFQFSETNFEKQILRMVDPPVSPQDFCYKFSVFYEQLAYTCVPTPTITGRRALMEKAMLPAFINPAAGNPGTAASGIANALPIFWIGVPVPGGVVTAFLGGAQLISNLNTLLNNPHLTPGQVAQRLTRCMKIATTTVQYVIPPAPPAFLVVP